MNFLDKLERKFGKYSIPNLMLYIMMGQAIVYLLSFIGGQTFINYLYFDIHAIFRGQIWRLFTHIFIPSATGIYFLFAVLLYYSIGQSLESSWGTFRFNLYYFSGAIFSMIGLTIIQLIFGPVYVSTTVYLHLTLFLAFAALFPDLQFLLMMIIPVKAKYLAFIDALFLGFSFLTGGILIKIFIGFSLLNFLLFFGTKLRGGAPRQTRTQKHFNNTVKRELKQGDPIKAAFHKCTVCGKTELTDPDMEFRYCSKCNGNYEYCMDHLHNHEHIQ